MYLTKEGRRHYLDFLRNVTPQALLIFIGTVLLQGGLNGTPTATKSVVGGILWLMAIFAAWCSCSLFLEPLKEQHLTPGRVRARAAYPDIDGNRAARLQQLAKRWVHLTPLVAELVVVLLIIEVTCAVAAVTGAFNAVNALHLR